MIGGRCDACQEYPRGRNRSRCSGCGMMLCGRCGDRTTGGRVIYCPECGPVTDPHARPEPPIPPAFQYSTIRLPRSK